MLKVSSQLLFRVCNENIDILYIICACSSIAISRVGNVDAEPPRTKCSRNQCLGFCSQLWPRIPTSCRWAFPPTPDDRALHDIYSVALRWGLAWLLNAPCIWWSQAVRQERSISQNSPSFIPALSTAPSIWSTAPLSHRSHTSTRWSS